jgi:hypothetical protein
MSSTSTAFSATSQPFKLSIQCHWCSREGHRKSQCNIKARACAQAQESAQKLQKKAQSAQNGQNMQSNASCSRNCRNCANKAQEDSEDAPSPPACGEVSSVTEFAGNASTPTHSASPSFSTPLQLDSNFYWLVDMGATSHMTPHCHWFKSYASCHIPIRLADNSVIYSAGMGSVVFEPILSGKTARLVEFL